MRKRCRKWHAAVAVGKYDEAVLGRDRRHREGTIAGVVAPLPNARPAFGILNALPKAPMEPESTAHLCRGR
jgi:hypothetical protein